MESKHTPGPWDTQHTATLEWAQQSVVYAEGQEWAVALVYDGEHHEANAALIAAAPDMYEALVDAARLVGLILAGDEAVDVADMEATYNGISAALAKATA